jgi:tRNA1Val (adenine37-N6)-methyltransferase
MIHDDRSTMKVGTDAILLGSWADPAGARTILDVGTGSGILALMLAQRSEAKIDAIDIDPESTLQAGQNVQLSPWKKRISVIHRSLQDHLIQSAGPYDLIITNPPFFRHSLKSPDPLKNLARHAGNLTFESMLHSITGLLAVEGSFYTIMPFTESQAFRNLAVIQGLFLHRSLRVRPAPGKPPHRILMMYRKSRCRQQVEEEIVILERPGHYSENYQNLTGSYYINF